MQPGNSDTNLTLLILLSLTLEMTNFLPLNKLLKSFKVFASSSSAMLGLPAWITLKRSKKSEHSASLFQFFLSLRLYNLSKDPSSLRTPSPTPAAATTVAPLRLSLYHYARNLNCPSAAERSSSMLITTIAALQGRSCSPERPTSRHCCSTSVLSHTCNGLAIECSSCLMPRTLRHPALLSSGI